MRIENMRSKGHGLRFGAGRPAGGQKTGGKRSEKRVGKVGILRLSMGVQVVIMAMGGWISVEISRVWTRAFLVGRAGMAGTAGAAETPETAELLEILEIPETAGQTGRLLGQADAFVRQRKPGNESQGAGGGFSIDGVACSDNVAKMYGPLEQRKKNKMSPERLNYAFLFDEGVQGEDAEESYGGKVYQLLTERDGSWIREIYSLGERPAEEMAAYLGVDIEEVSSWNRVNVIFRNGDGAPISGYSNAKEIISLASVYAYFQQWDDYESFFQYADALWRQSHSYHISVSDPYYCEGECQYTEKPGLETAGRVESISESADHAAACAGESAEDPAGSESSGILENVSSEDSEKTGSGPGGLAAEESAEEIAAAGDGETVSDASAAEGEADAPAAGDGVPQESELSVPQESELSDQSAVGDGMPEEEASAVEAEVSEADRSDAEEGGGEAEKAGQSAAGDGMPEAEMPDAGKGMWEEEISAARESVPVSDMPAPEAGALEAGISDAGEGVSVETVYGKACSGHRDLNISVKITGLKEAENLYEADSVGNRTESFGEQWSGWDIEARSHAANLAEQDWYEMYGLSSFNSVYVQNPLSQSEIAFYLNKLPETVPPERRELVRQALASVGCIPYYWGGKPSGGGLEVNHFGTVVEADEDGRILRGLDCSGWISWVYWTAFGNPVPAQSTSGLISCGRGIAKEELQAGDILVRTGEQPHVYLFLAWAEDGSMYLIHETTGNINNVTVDIYDIEVSHYRDLIGGE